MDLKLKDKVVLINGSTGGIGQALCRAFAAEGCKLAIASTSQKKLDAFVPTLDIASDNLMTCVTNVTDEQQVKAWIDGAYEKFGRIDVVVPNAGYEGKYQEIQDCTLEDYMAVYNVNVFSVMFVMKHAASYLKKTRQRGHRYHCLQRKLYHFCRYERLLFIQARGCRYC